MRSKTRSGSASLCDPESRALSLICFVLSVVSSCKGNSLKVTDGSALSREGGSSIEDSQTSVGSSCGGTAQVTGTTPVGPFPGTFAFAQVAGPYCSNPGSLYVSISDLSSTPFVSSVLSFVVALPQGADPNLIIGQSTVDVEVSMHGLGSNGWTATKGTVTITAASNPLVAISNPDGSVVGAVSGTVSLVQDGFSLAGSFQSPYCSQYVCSSP